MRKILGGFLAFVAALFLGLAYTQLAVADDKACRDELTKRILELVESDGSDILQKQFELATLKLAEVTADSRSLTLEDYFRKQEDVIDKLDQKDVQKDLVKLYREFGEKEDQAEVVDRFEASKTKIKKGSYWRPATRFKNQDVSALALAHTYVHGAQSPFQAEDIAILWLQAEISQGVTEKAGRGSAAANMTEVSTLVARMTGAISGVTGKSLEEIKAAKKDVEAQIGGAFDKIVEKYRKELAEVCPELKTKDGQVCADCKITEKTKIDALGATIGSVMQKLRADPEARNKKIDQVIAEMRAKGYEVKSESAPETKVEKIEEKKDGEKVNPFFLQMLNQQFVEFEAKMRKGIEVPSLKIGGIASKRDIFNLVSMQKPTLASDTANSAAKSPTAPAKRSDENTPELKVDLPATIVYDHQTKYVEGCTTELKVIEENGKITIAFRIRHDATGKIFCDKKAYYPLEAKTFPKEFDLGEALKVCPELAKADSEFCKSKDAAL